jgi:SAM-dependent methyltransferase
MNAWGAGYVTDVTYLHGWYRQQSPSIIALASLLCSVAVPFPRDDDPVTVLELGCGQGYGAMVLAASNPGWRITAIDFNPAHIAEARDWASEAGLTNIDFIEADLATLAEDAVGRALPEADFVTMHGVWSWVPPAVRAGIVRLLRAKLRPGGAVHVSYNALPAWGPAMGMQRLLRESGKRLGWRSDRQAEEGFAVVKKLANVEARQIHRSPFARMLIERLETVPLSYLAHEYMNDSWSPCFHMDVAEALAEAKLEWVGSSQLAENFPGLMMTETQGAVAQNFDDPLMRELVKDMCVERALRHDVFVRGARRMSNAARNDALMEVAIGLNIDPADLPMEAEMPAGKAELNQRFYRPIVEAVRAGPRRVGELLELPEVEGKRDNPAELIGILVGMELAEPAIRPTVPPSDTAVRFNRVTARRFARTETLGRHVGIASHRLGTGLPASMLDLLVLDRVLDGVTTVESLAASLEVGDEQKGKMMEALDGSLRIRMPILRAAGVF